MGKLRAVLMVDMTDSCLVDSMVCQLVDYWAEKLIVEMVVLKDDQRVGMSVEWMVPYLVVSSVAS